MKNLLIFILLSVGAIDGWAFAKTGQWWLILHAILVGYTCGVLIESHRKRTKDENAKVC